jgi:hypothetical protein
MRRATIATAMLTALLCLPAVGSAAPIPLPGVELVADDCSPCHTGDHIRITLNIWRPGVSIGKAEVWASVRTPSGSVIRLPVSGTVLTLPAGLSSLALLDGIVAVTPGVYLIEGAILDAQTGVTLDRAVIGILVQ